MKEVVNAFVASASARSLDPLAAGRRSTPGQARRATGDVIADGLAPQHTHADAFRGHADIDRKVLEETHAGSRRLRR